MKVKRKSKIGLLMIPKTILVLSVIQLDTLMSEFTNLYQITFYVNLLAGGGVINRINKMHSKRVIFTFLFSN